MNDSPPPPHQSSTTTTTTACSAAAATCVVDSLVSSSHTAPAAAAALTAASSTSSSLSRRDAVLQLALDTALFFWLLPKDVFMIVVRMLLCSTWSCLFILFIIYYTQHLTIVRCFSGDDSVH